MSKWLKISSITVGAALAAAVSASIAVYHNMTHISDSEKEKGHHKAVAENTAADNVWYLKQPIQEWRQTTPDANNAQCQLYPSSSKKPAGRYFGTWHQSCSRAGDPHCPSFHNRVQIH